ncbi:lipopolysaccharide biosynthesis protein [Leucobacter sp. USHLN153]|uniref:lipopolysaccharide biosynthesis protein n=1 Tax=Leucobacter sp. USHLN153 TaxID=3081268 RepID=UPI00301AF48A
MKLGKALVAAGTFGGAIAQWVTVLIIARTLGAGEVGVYAEALATATPLFVAGSLALRELFVSLSDRPAWAAFVRTRVLGLAASALCFAVVGLLLGWPREVLLALTLLKCADSACDLVYGRLQLAEDWLAWGGLSVANSVLSVGGVLVVAVLGGGLGLMLAVSGGVSLACAAVALLRCRRSAPLEASEPVSRRAVLLLARRGLPLSGAQLLSSVLFNAPVLVVSALGTSAEAGAFAAAAYLLTFGNLVGSAIANLEIVRIRGAFQAHGSAGLRAALWRPTVVLLVGGTVGVLLVGAWGSEVLAAVFGPAFAVSRAVLVGVALAAVVGALGFVAAAGLLVMNRYVRQALVSATAVIGAFGCALVLHWAPNLAATLAGAIVALVGALLRTGLLAVSARRE